MGFRFRRRVRLAPGLRINLSKSGASLSIGHRGATMNFGPKGKKVTIGLPGTGLSYTASRPWHQPAEQPPAPPPRAPTTASGPAAARPQPARNANLPPQSERMFGRLVGVAIGAIALIAVGAYFIH